MVSRSQDPFEPLLYSKCKDGNEVGGVCYYYLMTATTIKNNNTSSIAEEVHYLCKSVFRVSPVASDAAVKNGVCVCECVCVFKQREDVRKI